MTGLQDVLGTRIGCDSQMIGREKGGALAKVGKGMPMPAPLNTPSTLRA